MDGVVFLDEDDRQAVLVREGMRTVPMSQCYIPLERRFTFYDQVQRQCTAYGTGRRGSGQGIGQYSPAFSAADSVRSPPPPLSSASCLPPIGPLHIPKRREKNKREQKSRHPSDEIPPNVQYQNRDMCPQGGKTPGASTQSHDPGQFQNGDIVMVAS